MSPATRRAFAFNPQKGLGPDQICPKTYRSPDLSLFITRLCAKKYPREGVPMNKTIEVIKDIRTLCTHVFEGGHRAPSPALQREPFCYYHPPTRKPLPNPTRRRSRRQSFDLPLPSGQSH